MQTHDKTTTDNARSSPAAAQQKPGSGIMDKIGGVVNVIHGTGEVIRGHALEAGDCGRGDGKGRELITAGRDEVERGLSRVRVEGRPTATPTGHDQDRDQRGVDDGTSSGAPGHDPNTPQATAASRADPTSEKGRGDVADTSYLADRGTDGTAANGTHGPSPDQYHGEQTAATTPPRDPLSATDGPGVQPNTDVRQQGNGIAPSDRGKETSTTADASYPADVVGQKQSSGTASQA